MANIFSLDADTKKVIQDALDDLLANTDAGGLGKTCQLVYPAVQVRCQNCVYDAVTNRSANRPKSGAPVPFAVGGSCPMCSGRGMKEERKTEEITLKCNWDAKKFHFAPADFRLRSPHSVLETKCYLKDLPKLVKAEYIVVNLPIAPIIRQEFVLVGEPGDPSNIIQGRYAVALWERKK